MMFGNSCIYSQGLQMIFGLTLLVGVVLFILWAIKSLSKDDLKRWALWLLVIGLLGLLFTSSWFGRYPNMNDGIQIPGEMQEDIGFEAI